ncbi:MAG: four-helix bundle copper-binding protein [Leptospiraceae bacterium]|nr:four-helix bundle copper-binding protein [Leptospiraceae bacterium]MCK6382585.1 four-helix bundle copper-binding protein [Leptospiraceae bacterium]NUM42457.1 four-helix bundle copper-binding protein [Leptospiraceae bacterium]
MKRKDFISKATAITTGLVATGILSQTKKHDHDHSDPNHKHDPKHDHSKHIKYGMLITKIMDCIKTGNICKDHCLMSLADGDKTMLGCAKSVNEMLSSCEALFQLAVTNSEFTPKMATLCMEICLKCEKECQKHASKHKVCADCGASCKACADECKKIAA